MKSKPVTHSLPIVLFLGLGNPPFMVGSSIFPIRHRLGSPHFIVVYIDYIRIRPHCQVVTTTSRTLRHYKITTLSPHHPTSPPSVYDRNSRFLSVPHPTGGLAIENPEFHADGTKPIFRHTPIRSAERPTLWPGYCESNPIIPKTKTAGENVFHAQNLKYDQTNPN